MRTTLTEDGHTSGRPIVVWISDTPSRVPVKLQSELRVGSFVLALNQANREALLNGQLVITAITTGAPLAESRLVLPGAATREPAGGR